MIPADGRSKDKSGFIVALCLRCANLWRKYAVKWENVDDIAKKVAQGGGKAWKRRIDEELLREVYAAQSDPSSKNGTPEYADLPTASAHPSAEPPKKKQKTTVTANGDSGASTPVNESISKKKEKEKPVPVPKAPTPPPVPAPPKLRALPCAVCRSTEGLRLECTACRLTVHKSCYGVEETRQPNKWYCDMCKNDKKESVSYVSCPSIVLDQRLTRSRPTSVFFAHSEIQTTSSTSNLRSHTRRKRTETGRKNDSKKSLSTKLKRTIASVSKKRVDHWCLANRLNVPLITTGSMSIVHYGTLKSSSVTLHGSIWWKG